MSFLTKKPAAGLYEGVMKYHDTLTTPCYNQALFFLGGVALGGGILLRFPVKGVHCVFPLTTFEQDSRLGEPYVADENVYLPPQN